uniref:Uncharacterized protein n=1 Tax=Glossina brevipalpis TaxID=37001 RepID=A0A1A9WUL9_9MUSC
MASASLLNTKCNIIVEEIWVKLDSTYMHIYAVVCVLVKILSTVLTLTLFDVCRFCLRTQSHRFTALYIGYIRLGVTSFALCNQHLEIYKVSSGSPIISTSLIELV